jgi:hypothetical protein
MVILTGLLLSMKIRFADINPIMLLLFAFLFIYSIAIVSDYSSHPDYFINIFRSKLRLTSFTLNYTLRVLNIMLGPS